MSVTITIFHTDVTFHVCLGIPTETDLTIHLIWDFPIDRNFKYWIRNDADLSRPKCVSDFCADGSIAKDMACGVGDCNWFGCGCKGGCRKGNGTSYEKMGRLWREKHGLLRREKHQLRGMFE